MQHRDDRDLNEFHIAEVFEINGFLQQDKPGSCTFVFPNNLIVHYLPLPENDRRSPFALPHPGHYVHIIEVSAPLPQQARTRGGGVDSPFLNFTREVQTMHRFWGLTLTLKTLADSVPVTQLNDYKKLVHTIRERSMWRITVPLGHSRPMRRSDFGALPRQNAKVERPASAPTPPQTSEGVADQPARTVAGSPPPKNTESQPQSSIAPAKDLPQIAKSDWSKRQQRRSRKWSRWKICLAAFGILWVLLLLLLLLERIFSK
jgi:hypothetical protein